MFIEDSEELWFLTQVLKEEDFKKLGISKNRRELALGDFSQY